MSGPRLVTWWLTARMWDSYLSKSPSLRTWNVRANDTTCALVTISRRSSEMMNPEPLSEEGACIVQGRPQSLRTALLKHCTTPDEKNMSA